MQVPQRAAGAAPIANLSAGDPGARARAES